MTARPVYDSTACRSPRCGALIMLLPTPDGKHMPVDLGRDPSGPLVGVRIGQHGWGVRVLREGEDAGGRPRYVPHWATCPDADWWRNRRQRAVEAELRGALERNLGLVTAPRRRQTVGGSCARCGQGCHVYGAGGRPLCDICGPSTAHPRPGCDGCPYWQLQMEWGDEIPPGAYSPGGTGTDRWRDRQ